VLVDAYAGAGGCGAQTVGQPRRIHQRGSGASPHPAEESFRSDLSPDLVAIEQLDLVAEAAEQFGFVDQVGDLTRLEGHHEIADRLELGVDVVVAEVVREALEVLAPQALEGLDLTREASEPVACAVGQRGLDEAAVAPAGAGPTPGRLEQHDLAAGVQRLGVERSPEPRVAAADNAQIGLERLFERWIRLAGGERVEPE